MGLFGLFDRVDDRDPQEPEEASYGPSGTVIGVAILVALLALGLGYWVGHRGPASENAKLFEQNGRLVRDLINQTQVGIESAITPGAAQGILTDLYEDLKAVGAGNQLGADENKALMAKVSQASSACRVLIAAALHRTVHRPAPRTSVRSRRARKH